MKKIYLTFLLVFWLFSIQCWAQPPGESGATRGPDLSLDIKKCNLIPRSQTKRKVKEKSGHERFICTGLADCKGKQIPVICKASERGACPTAEQCLVFDQRTSDPPLPEPIPYPINELKKNDKLKFNVRLNTENASMEPEREKIAFVLEIRKKRQVIHSEPPLYWKTKKKYEILNLDITKKLTEGMQEIYLWSFIDFNPSWGYIDLTYELSINDKIVVRRTFGLQMPRFPRMPDIPNPFPYTRDEPYFPRPREGDRGPDDRNSFNGNVTKISIEKSKN